MFNSYNFQPKYSTLETLAVTLASVVCISNMQNNE